MWIERTDDVVREFGEDSAGVPRYLHLLNLMWPPEGLDVTLSRLQEVGARLDPRGRVLADMVRGGGGWRNALVGCGIAIVLTRRDVVFDMIIALEQHCWVAPQLAAAVGILGDTSAGDYLELSLQTKRYGTDAKAGLAIWSALTFLGRPVAENFRKSLEYETLMAEDEDHTVRIAQQHWSFWTSVRLPAAPN